MSTRAPRRPHAPAFALAACLAAACGAPTAPAGPAAPRALAPPPAAVLTLDAAPAAAPRAAAPSRGLGTATRGGCVPGAADCTLWLDTAAVDVRVVAVRAGGVGEAVPGKVRLTLDVAVAARAGVALGAPRDVAPFAGNAGGPVLALVAAEAPDTPGGVATGGEGNTVVVQAPGGGTVTPGPGWRAEPAAGVRAWADVGAAVPAGGAVTVRGLAFDVDPTVRAVRLRLAVAAAPQP